MMHVGLKLVLPDISSVECNFLITKCILYNYVYAIEKLFI